MPKQTYQGHLTLIHKGVGLSRFCPCPGDETKEQYARLKGDAYKLFLNK